VFQANILEPQLATHYYMRLVSALEQRVHTMDNTLLIALITTGGTIIVALIAILPHLLKNRDKGAPSAIAEAHFRDDPRNPPATERPPPGPLGISASQPGVARSPVASADQTAIEDEESGSDQPVGSARREETMKVLFRFGRILPGTEIEPMPRALPTDGASFDPHLFRVRIANPPGREVVWLANGNTYTLSKLSNMLANEHGLQWFKNRTFELWRIVGQAESMWDQAEQLLQQEGMGS
jgi:hypothetical protein